MIDNITIVRAVYSGLSQRQVAATHKVSRNTVSLLLKHAKQQGWKNTEDLEGIDEARFIRDLTSPLLPPARDKTFRMPDYEYVHSELAKPHVTLKLLWEEYRRECQAGDEQFYMETQFRHYYHKFARIHKATIRLDHKPALAMEVDWAGTKIGYYDDELGEMNEASLFVAVLPCSQLMYAEPFRDETLPSWVTGHVNAFGYINGVPKTVVPDNLKSGVTTPDFYEPQLNKTYHEMADYYGTVILPARVRRPKDKPSAENSVLIASRRILAKLRNVQILSFADLQSHVRTALYNVNEAPLTGKSESRWTAYQAEEQHYMLPLPKSPYEMAQWGKAKVQMNCHIAYQRKFYSVPFEYLGEEVEVRATQRTLEIFYHHQRIASHKRLWGKSNYSTDKEHMPPDKVFFADWDSERFLCWGERIGPSTRQVITLILERAVIEQQAYRSCFGVLSLKNKHGELKLERACAQLVATTSTPTYQQVKNILDKESKPLEPVKSDAAPERPAPRGHQRGANYFGGGEDA